MGTSVPAPTVVVVMGVAASGKSTVGRLLARRRGVPFVEGDELHPAENVARMARGESLDDEDRRPWLQALAARIRTATQDGTGAVISCSALRYAYRQLFREAGSGVWFLHLDLDPEVAQARIDRRTGHFMPAALLGSQFEALEPLRPGEPGLTVDAAAGPEAVLEAAEAALADFEARGRR
ncbi:gluconokinase [Kitasatospora sp. NBC_00240]|uniref:gluconokinase n=1 Tax=Kitasatospora sp. NBC_00240 TaxID=2903567 RepID=UPI00225C110E|nr:gluconokinase [Kitasatospora sp. NBC_00240]MCX5208207.1 gluconokinase [Kitasatospora sp. NBC_00240]